MLANAWSPNQTVIAFTEVHYVEISGNWYWDDANIRGWDYQIQTPVDIYSGNMAWYLDWQSTDIIPPTSQVLLMPNPQPYFFLVEWLGTDNVTEIRQYDVQARVGEDGTWYDWIMGTRYTYGWWYEGQGGQTYYSRSRAYDYAGNVEAWPADYDLAGHAGAAARPHRGWPDRGRPREPALPGPHVRHVGRGRRGDREAHGAGRQRRAAQVREALRLRFRVRGTFK